jgi:endonuclease/exonuclease/phosphatase family metal-dependent hydrolase
VKVIQLNIHWDEFLERSVPFLEEEHPDVVCLQEVYERDLIRLAKKFGMQSVFAPMMLNASAEGTTAFQRSGVGILSRPPIEVATTRWYFGDGVHIPVHNREDRDTSLQPLLTCTIDCMGTPIVIGTTHFQKSWHGLPDDYQRERMERFLPVLTEAHPDILCGDFNIPRGTELYQVLHERLCDNVPSEYVNSIDPQLHRVHGLSYMIDYMWSSPRVRIQDVRQVCGVSDHCAFVGEVQLVPDTA